MPILTPPASPTHEREGARFTSLATPSSGSRDTSVWRVELAPGTQSVLHELTREEIFVVLRGSARVQLADESRDVGVGDVIVVPSDTPFGLSNPSSREPFEALCCLPVGGEARVDGAVFVPPWAR
jgi:mannose-6-phosphate isomerase-like protein (cupin superfamily)